MNIKSKLRCRRGSAYIQAMIVTLMLMTLVATAIQIAGVFTIKKGLVDMATETARYIELRGALNSAVYTEFDRLKNVTGLNPQLTVDGDFTSSGKLQLEAPFTVTVSDTAHIFFVEIPLLGKATGRSEVYHK